MSQCQKGSPQLPPDTMAPKGSSSHRSSSYLQAKIDKAAAELRRLSEQVAQLERGKVQLQAQVDTHAAGLELADFELQVALAGQVCLSRQAGKLLHQQLRLLGSMSSLPPAEQWDATIRTHIANMGREQLRYLLLTGYKAYNEWLRAPNAFQNPDTVREMSVCANKIKHVNYCFSKNPATWCTIINTNLETGEGPVPASLVNNAAMALPMRLLPPGFLDYLQEGFRLYNKDIEEFVGRRFRLGQRVNEALQLLPRSTKRAYSSNSSYHQLLYTAPGGAGDVHAGWPERDRWAADAASEPLEAVISSDLDVVCQLDQDLREYEATIVQEFRARQVFFEYILRRLPLHFLACYVVACQPYHMYLPTTLAAVLRLYNASKQGASPQHSQHSELAEPAQQQKVVTVHAGLPTKGTVRQRSVSPPSPAHSVQQQLAVQQQSAAIEQQSAAQQQSAVQQQSAAVQQQLAVRQQSAVVPASSPRGRTPARGSTTSRVVTSGSRSVSPMRADSGTASMVELFEQEQQQKRQQRWQEELQQHQLQQQLQQAQQQPLTEQQQWQQQLQQQQQQLPLKLQSWQPSQQPLQLQPWQPPQQLLPQLQQWQAQQQLRQQVPLAPTAPARQTGVPKLQLQQLPVHPTSPSQAGFCGPGKHTPFAMPLLSSPAGSQCSSGFGGSALHAQPDAAVPPLSGMPGPVSSHCRSGFGGFALGAPPVIITPRLLGAFSSQGSSSLDVNEAGPKSSGAVNAPVASLLSTPGSGGAGSGSSGAGSGSSGPGGGSDGAGGVQLGLQLATTTAPLPSALSTPAAASMAANSEHSPATAKSRLLNPVSVPWSSPFGGFEAVAQPDAAHVSAPCSPGFSSSGGCEAAVQPTAIGPLVPANQSEAPVGIIGHPMGCTAPYNPFGGPSDVELDAPDLGVQPAATAPLPSDLTSGSNSGVEGFQAMWVDDDAARQCGQMMWPDGDADDDGDTYTWLLQGDEL